MTQIDYYFSTLSPFTYLAGLRLEEIAERQGAQIIYKPLDIIGLFGRTGGIPPGQRHISRQEYRAQDLPRQARRAGLPLNLKPAHWPTNPAPSSYAIVSAVAAGGGDVGALVHSLTRACWVEEKDIAEDAVIAECMTGAGFDPAIATSGMAAAAETYAANLEQAVAAGVFGAPFYIATGDARFWGQDRLDDLEHYLSEQAV